MFGIDPSGVRVRSGNECRHRKCHREYGQKRECGDKCFEGASSTSVVSGLFLDSIPACLEEELLDGLEISPTHRSDGFLYQ